jgi:hypothetical protein
VSSAQGGHGQAANLPRRPSAIELGATRWRQGRQQSELVLAKEGSSGHGPGDQRGGPRPRFTARAPEARACPCVRALVLVRGGAPVVVVPCAGTTAACMRARPRAGLGDGGTLDTTACAHDAG